MKKVSNQFNRLKNSFGRPFEKVDDIFDFAIHAFNDGAKTHSVKGHESFKYFGEEIDTVLYLSFDTTYNKHIMNSHSCPLNGVKNFFRQKHLPQSYPGLAGTMKLVSISALGLNSVMHSTQIQTGNGESGRRYHLPVLYSHKFKENISWHQITSAASRFGLSVQNKRIWTPAFTRLMNLHISTFNVLIFSDDFPIIEKEREQLQVLNALQNTNNNLKLNKTYIHPALLKLYEDAMESVNYVVSCSTM